MLLQGEPAIPKSPSRKQRGFGIAFLEKGGESGCRWLWSITWLRSLVSLGHLSRAVPGRLVRKWVHQCQGTGKQGQDNQQLGL